MITAQVRDATLHWPPLSKIIHMPGKDSEYRQLVAFLDKLIDEVGEDETHPLASLMEVLGILIEQYENLHIPKLT